jgi:hypothetical protein
VEIVTAGRGRLRPEERPGCPIQDEAEEPEARHRLTQDREAAARQPSALEGEGLRAEELARGMAPLLSFQAQLAE